MPAPLNTIGGYPVYADRPAQWPLVAGIGPQSQVFEFREDAAEEILSRRGGPMTLEVNSSDRPYTQAGLWPIEERPTEHRDMIGILFVDRRHWWTRRWVSRTYNQRRATSEAQVYGTRVETITLLNRIAYTEPSLNGGIPWELRPVLEDVFAEVDPDGSLVIPPLTLPDLDVEDWEVDDRGDAAMAYVLGQAGGLNLFVTRDDTVKIFDATKPDELGLLSGRTIHHPLMSGGSLDFPRLIRRKAIRPRSYILLFDREVEVKLKCKDVKTFTRDDRAIFECINIAQQPDIELVVDGKTQGVSSWGQFGSSDAGLIEAWNSDNPAPAPPGPLSQDLIRQTFASGMKAVGDQIVGVTGAVDVVWARRLDAILAHWRQSWKINPRLWERVRTISATRVAIIDQATGARGRAPVFTDYMVRPTFRGIAKQGGSDRTDLGWIINGYDEAINSGSPGPIHVRIVDPQSGIFRLEPRVDPWGEAAQVILGHPLNDEVPGQSPALFNRDGAQVLAQWDMTELKGSWQADVILTVTLGAPNNNNRLHPIEVHAAEIGDAGANGPPMYLRVHPSILTAKFFWDDAFLDAVSEDILRDDPGFWPDALMVNGAHLGGVAFAMAQAALSEMRDTVMTRGAELDLDPELEPVGAITSVTHGYDSGGGATTFVTSGRPISRAAFWRYLPASTRRLILRSPQVL